MKKISLRRKLIRLFGITSIIPILILSFFSYYNISHTLKENTRKLTNNSLKQIDDNLQIWMDSYEDLLYQIYTDEDIATWVDNLNEGEDISVTKNQIRRYMRRLLNTKDYIRSITIMSNNGTVVTYDQLTSATYQNSWIGRFSLKSDELYETVLQDYKMHVFSTEYATKFANKDYYLFHIAHRIIDYKNLEKKIGIAVISIDEDLLRNICKIADQENDENNFNFIVNESGRIVSFMNNKNIGRIITNTDKGLDERIADYNKFIETEEHYSQKYTSVYAYQDTEFGWDIVNVTDQSNLMLTLENQVKMILLLNIALFSIAILVTLGMSGKLVKSVKTVLDTMKRTRNGDLSMRVEVDDKMPLEIESIAVGFNDMLKKLEIAILKEKQADEKQKEAQIVALEAQINPHFLYNTLDTINWMAIDKDEYDISNAINALATILRYAIVNSNAEVNVKEEIEWLKKYIYLQQFRNKNKFECRIEIAPETMGDKIHKLLLQPFIENAIIHGFEGIQKDACLWVSIKEQGDELSISICDNGIGIEPEIMEKLNREIFDGGATGYHIGMENAITRLQMYYGKRGKIMITSKLGEGTKINISIPLIKE